MISSTTNSTSNTRKSHLRPLVVLSVIACLSLIVWQGLPSATSQDLPEEYQQGVQALQSGQLQQAEAYLRKATELAEDNGQVWYVLGISLNSQQKWDEAVTVFRKAAEFETVRGRASFGLAVAFAGSQKNDDALEALSQAVEAGFNDRTRLLGTPQLAALQSDPRFQELIPQPFQDDELFEESSTILHTFHGEAANDQFGWVARVVGDVDGDSVSDFVTTAPTFNSGAGKIYVYSSKDGDLLYSVTGEANQRLGNGAAGAGDANADGIPDVIVGAPGTGSDGQPGKAFVYSGIDGERLLTLEGDQPDDRFGYKVCALGDVDEDGHDDVLVGAIGAAGEEPNAGRATGFSGRTGEPLFVLNGESSGDKFGSAAAGWSQPDEQFFAIGAQDAGPSDRGSVYVYSIVQSKPELAFVIEPRQGSVELGQMFVSFLGDTNGDGVTDIYASDFSDQTNGPSTGSIVVHSGADGSELLRIDGTHPGEGFGTSPSDAGDVDGDGSGDLIIGAWQNREAATSAGKVYLYSGRDGELIRTWTCRESGDTFGFDATGIGDVNGDGAIDFLLTSAWSSVRAPRCGRVFIVSGESPEK